MEFTVLKNNRGSFRRHIIVDNVSRIISIEVQWDITGALKLQEYQNIMRNGQWWRYVPKKEIEQFRKCINNGYRLQAVWNSGVMNDEFYIIQIAGFEQEKPVIV